MTDPEPLLNAQPAKPLGRPRRKAPSITALNTVIARQITQIEEASKAEGPGEMEKRVRNLTALMKARDALREARRPKDGPARAAPPARFTEMTPPDDEEIAALRASLLARLVSYSAEERADPLDPDLPAA